MVRKKNPHQKNKWLNWSRFSPWLYGFTLDVHRFKTHADSDTIAWISATLWLHYLQLWTNQTQTQRIIFVEFSRHCQITGASLVVVYNTCTACATIPKILWRYFDNSLKKTVSNVWFMHFSLLLKDMGLNSCVFIAGYYYYVIGLLVLFYF